MKARRLSGQTLGQMLAVLLLAGCGGASPGPTAAHPLVSPTATLAPTATRTPVPQTATAEPTAAPPATLPVARPSLAPAEIPKGPGVEWRLVVISESSGWGLGSAYASQIEKDMGVKVTLDDFAIGDLRAVDVLDALQTGTSSVPRLEALPAALRKADVVLLFPGPMGSIHDDTFLNIRRCFGNVTGTPEPCPSNGFDEYAADLEAIWARVFELRSGQPTLLRALDAASPFVSRWNANGSFEACTACWECGSTAARRAADAFHVPFLSRYDVYNGAGHDQDPKQQGYIGADGVHPNGLAQQYTAELLSKLGYVAVTPP